MSISQRAQVTIAVAIVALLGAGLVVFGRVAATKESDANIQQRMDHLEAAVQAAEGVRAIKRLHYSYAHYLESGLWNDLADLFTDNAAGAVSDGLGQRQGESSKILHGSGGAHIARSRGRPAQRASRTAADRHAGRGWKNGKGGMARDGDDRAVRKVGEMERRHLRKRVRSSKMAFGKSAGSISYEQYQGEYELFGIRRRQNGTLPIISTPRMSASPFLKVRCSLLVRVLPATFRRDNDWLNCHNASND